VNDCVIFTLFCDVHHIAAIWLTNKVVNILYMCLRIT